MTRSRSSFASTRKLRQRGFDRVRCLFFEGGSQDDGLWSGGLTVEVRLGVVLRASISVGGISGLGGRSWGPLRKLLTYFEDHVT